MYIHTTLLRLFIVATLFAFSFGTASAQEVTTTSETTNIEALTAQIAELLEVVASLQAQLTSSISGNTPTNTTSFTFNTNLTVGSENEDVRQLQIVLNANPQTKVAQTGAGSPGNETTYFGPRTAQAVIAFQNLHKADILTPVGLTSGTGYVGPSTRKLLNEARSFELQEGTFSFDEETEDMSDETESTANMTEDSLSTDEVVVAEEPENNDESSAESDTETVFAVGQASTYVGAPGETIILSGTKLTNDVQIYFEDDVVTGSANENGTELMFTVPDFKKGAYELTFEQNGETALRIMDFAITVPDAVAPSITSISPEQGKGGTVLTITGTGFTETNNRVSFGTNHIDGLVSLDGMTLVATVTPDVELAPSGTPGVEDSLWPLLVYVVNPNGFAPQPAVFGLEN